jgi:elongation factor Ts
MTLSMGDIQYLRQETGAKIVDCKEALVASNGDIEEAKEWLRKKGMASGAKKTERVAAEGVVSVFAKDGFGLLIEVNCETDFVARSQGFQDFVYAITQAAVEHQVSTLDELLELNLQSLPIKERMLELAGKVGENIVLRRMVTELIEPGVVVHYTHSPLSTGLGKMGVLVALHSEVNPSDLVEVGKKLAMHIAAANPQCVSLDQADETAVAKERKFLLEQVEGDTRPPQVIEKIIEGRLRKFLETIVLEEQDFICDSGKKVKLFLQEESARLGGTIRVAHFVRFMLGS